MVEFVQLHTVVDLAIGWNVNPHMPCSLHRCPTSSRSVPWSDCYSFYSLTLACSFALDLLPGTTFKLKLSNLNLILLLILRRLDEITVWGGAFRLSILRRGNFSLPHPPMSTASLNFSSAPSLVPSSSLMPTLTPVVPRSDTPLGSQTSARLHRISSRESLSVSACDQPQLLLIFTVFLLRCR